MAVSDQGFRTTSSQGSLLGLFAISLHEFQELGIQDLPHSKAVNSKPLLPAAAPGHLSLVSGFIMLLGKVF